MHESWIVQSDNLYVWEFISRNIFECYINTCLYVEWSETGEHVERWKLDLPSIIHVDVSLEGLKILRNITDKPQDSQP